MATTGWLGEQTVHQWGGWGTRFTTNVYISGIRRYSDHVDVSGTIYLYCKSNGAYSVWYDWNITSWSMGNNLGQIKERTYTNNILNRSWGKNFTVRINCSNSATSATFNAGFSDSNMGGRDKYWTIYFDRYATVPSGIKSTSSYTEYSTITTSCSGINWGQGYSNRTLTCTASYTFNGKTENFTLGTWTDGATSKTVTKNDFNFPADLNVSIKWVASTNVGSTTSSSQVRVGQTYPAPNLSEVNIEGSSPSTYKLNATVTGINYGENYSKREAKLYFDYTLDGISYSTLLSSISDGSTSMTVEYDATNESEPWKFIPDDEKGILRLVVDNGHRTSTKSSAQFYCQPQYEAYIVESIPDSEKEKSEIYTGKNIQIQNSPKDAPLADFKLYGDTCQQTYTGKNIVDINFADSTSNGVTKTLNADGSITLNGHTTSGNNFEIAPAVDFEIGKTYTIHIEVLSGSFVPYNSNKDWAVTFVYAEDGGTTLQANVTENGATASYTPTSQMKSFNVRLWFAFNSSTTSDMAIFNNFTFRAQIEKGSTATSYEPYVGGTPSPNPDYPQDIRVVTGENVVKVTGKNILKPSENLQASRQGLTNVVNDDGSIITSGKPTANWNSVVYPIVDITDMLEDGETYTISQKVKTNKLYLQVNARNKNTGNVQYIALDNATSKSFTVDKSSYTYSYLIQSPLITTWGDDTLTITNYYQLEKSSQATDFEPYQEQTYTLNLGSIELCGLGDNGEGGYLYKDSIYRNLGDGKWYVHKDVGKIMLDESKTYSSLDDGPNGIKRFKFTDSSIRNIPNYSLGVISDIWKGAVYGSGEISEFHPNTIAMLSSNNIFAITTDSTTYTVDDFKTLLNTNPATVYYALATPSDTIITDQTLIEQLESISNASLQNGTNTITNIAIAPNLAGDMEISYYTKWQDTFPATLYSNGKNGTGQFKQIRRIGTK